MLELYLQQFGPTFENPCDQFSAMESVVEKSKN
jgi:hypothetical protein